MAPGSNDFDAVFTAHADFAWRSLRRLGVAERDLEDVAQEVFVVVLRGLEGFEARSSIKTWIYGICRGVAANHRRKGSNARELPDQAWVDSSADESPHGMRAPDAALGDRQLLERLLDRLSPEQREAFVLYEIEDLTMREIGVALACPEDTAYSRVKAARRVIEAELTRLRAQRRVA
jgi:RNA polymerase sigma-70 factor (ECF subfamily)